MRAFRTALANQAVLNTRAFRNGSTIPVSVAPSDTENQARSMQR
jgi:hypothetical protein